MSAITEEIGTVTAILETIFFAPFLLAFLAERRKRQHSIDLSLEIEEVGKEKPKLAGLDDLLHDIRDIVDRAHHPEAYTDLKLGNEILLAGPPLSGKKALAHYIAHDANFDKIIVVHNPRNPDALARAKHVARRAARYQKIMLLLPRLDLIDDQDDEEILMELDALIKSTSQLKNALIIGTTNRLVPGSEVDNLFGVTLTLPGAPIVPVPQMPLLSDVHRMLAGVARFYLDSALKAGYRLDDITAEGAIARILLSVSSPAQVEDIIVLCQTTAIYRQRIGEMKDRVISAETLETALRRVVLNDDARIG